MCTKRPYATRWIAERSLAKLREKGYPVRDVHPCFDQHPGRWHVTSQSGASSKSGGR